MKREELNALAARVEGGRAMKYGNWEISHNPPPIPFRGFDWQFSHKDFDGADDACDNRYGAESTLEAVLDWIDDWEDEQFDEKGCQHGCPLAMPDSQCLAVSCSHRDELRNRLDVRSALRARASEVTDGIR